MHTVTETYNPHGYQLRTLQSMAAKPGFALFLDPGMGKTSTTLALLTILKKHAGMQAALVIAPIRPMRNTWPAEVQKWTEFTGLRVSIVHGSPAKRLAALRAEADIYLINPENVAWLAGTKDAHEACRADVLVVDESQKFKTHSATRFKALQALLPRFRRRYALTGTPSTENLLALWSQIYILDNGARLGKNITAYRKRFFDEIENRWGGRTYTPKHGAPDEIFELIADICVRLDAADYLSLPERRNNYIHVDLPSDARGVYETFAAEFGYGEEGASNSVTAANAAVRSAKLKQMANGRVYNDDGSVRVLHDAKLEALADLIDEQQGQPLLVAVAYQHDVAAIREFLQDHSIPYLGGGVSAAASDDIIARWNRREVPVLLAHPASVATGLNLQAGGRAMVWFGLSWSLEENIQMCARIWRQGQKNAVVIHYIVARDTVDQKVVEALAAKDGQQKALFAALKQLQHVRI